MGYDLWYAKPMDNRKRKWKVIDSSQKKFFPCEENSVSFTG